jgi:two-component sensor histidine kinase
VSERLIKPVISVESVPLDIDRLIPFALIVTELISNSLKHAFPDLSEREEVTGEVRIELGRGPNDKLLLTVSDNGVGLPAGLEIMKSGSLGLKLVNVLVRQLRGTMEQGSGPGTGTEFKVTFEGLK